MFAVPLSRALARRGVHYGWVVAAVSFVVMMSTAATVGMTGVLIKPLGVEFGWTIGSIAGPLALRLALFGAMAPFAAALMARYGMRTVILIALALIVAGLGAAILFMNSLLGLWLLWGLDLGIATGMTALVLGATVASRWFTARRGLVVGLLTASSATGQLAFLPLAAWLTDTYGWRAALAPAMAACAVAGAAVALLLCDRPADIGLLPYGATSAPPVVSAASPIRLALSTLAQAARTRTFWVLFATFFICGFSTNGLIQTHFIAFCSDFGVTDVQAASVLAAMGFCDLFGTIASGWLSDRIDARKLLFWYYGLRGLSLLYLPSSSFSFYGLSLFAVFYGLDWIATVPPTIRLASSAFGAERAPIVFGWIFTGHQLGAATAAFSAGWSRDTLSTYLPAFYAAGGFCLIAACLALAAAPAAKRMAGRASPA